MIRVKAKNLKAYEEVSGRWKLSFQQFPELLAVVKLFKASGKFDVLIDKKDHQFLRGGFDGCEKGARINILPNGEKLEKAFSLFSSNLIIHDQDSHDHWDVLYQNKGGTWSYVYTLAKRQSHRAKKYRKVWLLEKKYGQLVRNVSNGLLDSADSMALPMQTLLKTHIRVGNETYFKAHGHKGLTTLMKKDVKISGSLVKFNFIGKDGVPIFLSKKFSSQYVIRLKELLKSKKNDEFVFTKNGRVLHENDFKQAFLKYCGQEFYPHIIRSHYATTKVRKFLARGKIGKLEKEKLFMSLAHELGHKKFNKKKQMWQDSYVVTINSYIQPELFKKLV